MRDGTLIERAKGKACIVNPQWREKLEKITTLIEDIRRRFHQKFGLNEMLFHLRGPRRSHHYRFDEYVEDDRGLGNWMDKQRQDAIDIMNSLLSVSGQLK